MIIYQRPCILCICHQLQYNFQDEMLNSFYLANMRNKPAILHKLSSEVFNEITTLLFECGYDINNNNDVRMIIILCLKITGHMHLTGWFY